MNREPSFDELIGADASGEERERLLHAHELLLQVGPPPELPPSLRKAPSFGGGRVFRLQQRRVLRRRALVLIAAAVSVGAVFAAGYAVRGNGSSSAKSSLPAISLALKGTAAAPKGARATLEVWHSRDGNWPMTLSVVGLPKLPGHTYYDVYLVRNGRPWGLCGTFRVAGSSRPLVLTLSAPYSLRKGDSWIVTRPGAGGSEPGRTVLSPVSI